MTGVDSPPAIASVKMVFNPVVLRTILRISRGLTETVIGSLYAPYRTAGILPSRRIRRASFLPRDERTSAEIVTSFLTTTLLHAVLSKSDRPFGLTWVRKTGKPDFGPR